MSLITHHMRYYTTGIVGNHWFSSLVEKKSLSIKYILPIIRRSVKIRRLANFFRVLWKAYCVQQNKHRVRLV